MFSPPVVSGSTSLETRERRLNKKMLTLLLNFLTVVKLLVHRVCNETKKSVKTLDLLPTVRNFNGQVIL